MRVQPFGESAEDGAGGVRSGPCLGGHGGARREAETIDRPNHRPCDAGGTGERQAELQAQTDGAARCPQDEAHRDQTGDDRHDEQSAQFGGKQSPDRETRGGRGEECWAM